MQITPIIKPVSHGLLLAGSLVFSSYNWAEQSCSDMSINTCTLPFPSNFYTQQDAASPTGLRVDLKGSLFSAETEAQVIGYSTPEVYDGKTGFSAAAAVLFELDRAFDTDTLPLDGGDSVIVFDKNTGQRTAIRPGAVAYSNDEVFGDERGHIVEIYPRSRFDFGHTYIAVITQQLKPQIGGEYTPSSAITDLVSGQAEQSVKDHYGSALAYIEAQGIAADNVISLTEFTVADEYSSTSEFYKLIDIIEADDHPVRNIVVKQTPANAITYATVKGQVRLTDMRHPDHGNVSFQTGNLGREYWTDFVLKIPPAAKHGKVPVAIYGHGLSAAKESADMSVLITNSSRGVATIFIDQPYHGTRIEVDGYAISTLPAPNNLRRLSGMLAQSSLDLHALLSALKTSLADTNVVPENTFWNRIFHAKGINGVDLDLDNILYEGTSLGGVLGGTFLTTGRDIKGGFMQVTGSGISNILSHSKLFKSMKFDKMIPANATGAEAALFFHAMQTEVDISDSINFLQYLSQPVYGRQPRAATIHYGTGDEIVFNRSSEAFAELADIPLVGKIHRKVPHLRTADDFENGSGVVQTPALIRTFHLLDSVLGHASFLRPDAQIQMNRWLKQMTD
jgi:hypothetical protein